MKPTAIKSGLQRRLLLLLALPLILLALSSIYFDYQTAGSVALQKDQKLLRLIPLLADSVLPPGSAKDAMPVLMLAPEIATFVKDSQPSAGFRISSATGDFLAGESWIDGVVPPTREPEFHSINYNGVTYRIAAQRVQTAAGEVIVQLADGADARQQWVQSIWFKVLLPNLVLLLVAGFAVNWAVVRALKPLLDVTDTVERRSPRDLSALDAQATPIEVQPLVLALNRLFGLVHAHSESQRRFVADAAHQLRTPLAGLQAQVEAWAQAASMAQATSPNGQANITLAADTVIKLRSATRRTSQLANQLLALSRADALDTTEQAMQQVDLKELCEAVLAMYLDAAQDKGIDLGLQAEPAVAAGHEWLLRELLCNLVDNAVKYTPPGGSVTLRCGLQETSGVLSGNSSGSAGGDETGNRTGTGKTSTNGSEMAFLQVLDDGPGIARAEQPKVLERFYRVQGTHGEGNGLGLAIADEIARVHSTQLVLTDAHDKNRLPRGRCGLCVTLLLQQENPHTAA